MGYEIDFLAVGDTKGGDAIALRFGNLSGPRTEQFVAVVDGGYVDTGEELVKHLAQWYGTNHVDLVVSTHPDADHVGGLRTVLEKCTVGQLWMHRPWASARGIADMFRDGRVTDNSVRDSLRRSLEAAFELEKLAVRKRIEIVEPFAGLTNSTGHMIVVGPSEPFYASLLPGFRGTPEPAFPGLFQRAVRTVGEAIRHIAEDWHIETLTDEGETSAENNSSVVLLLAMDDELLLLTGDAGLPALTEAVGRMEQWGADLSRLGFIQVPHHGSQRNVGPTLLDRLVGPRGSSSQIATRVAFVSVPKDGVPKHPAKKVMNAFKRRGVAVHATAGAQKCHRRNAPDRGWTGSVPLPFYYVVEE